MARIFYYKSIVTSFGEKYNDYKRTNRERNWKNL